MSLDSDLVDDDYDVFQSALRRAVRSGASGERKLLDALAVVRDDEQAAGLVAAVGEADGPDGVAALREIFTRPDDPLGMRTNAVLALAKRQGVAASDVLVTWIGDADEDVRRMAMIALASAGDDRGTGEVLRRLQRVLDGRPSPAPYEMNDRTLVIHSDVLPAVCYLARHAAVSWEKQQPSSLPGGCRPVGALVHTSSVRLIGSVWHIGLPLVVVASCALVLISAARARKRPAPISRPVAAVVVLVWLRLAGEAAFGDQRPLFERQWKGAAAFFLALAGVVHLWSRYRDAPGRASAPQGHPAVAVTATQSKLDSRGAVLVTMPAPGEEVAEGTVTRWLKQVGDRVEAGEPLVEVSFDKVDVEIPAHACGELQEIRVSAGRVALVGATIAVIEPCAGVHPAMSGSCSPGD
jgi:biotin carboxyl carrier protein